MMKRFSQSTIGTKINMDDFLVEQPYPSDHSDYILLDESPVKCPFIASTEQLPKGVLFSPVASYADSGSRKQVVEFESRATWKQSLEIGLRVAFKTKSYVDIIDDGFKQRKYGKEFVKNSLNPSYLSFLQHFKPSGVAKVLEANATFLLQISNFLCMLLDKNIRPGVRCQN